MAFILFSFSACSSASRMAVSSLSASRSACKISGVMSPPASVSALTSSLFTRKPPSFSPSSSSSVASENRAFCLLAFHSMISALRSRQAMRASTERGVSSNGSLPSLFKDWVMTLRSHTFPLLGSLTGLFITPPMRGSMYLSGRLAPRLAPLFFCCCFLSSLSLWCKGKSRLLFFLGPGLNLLATWILKSEAVGAWVSSSAPSPTAAALPHLFLAGKSCSKKILFQLPTTFSLVGNGKYSDLSIAKVLQAMCHTDSLSPTCLLKSLLKLHRLAMDVTGRNLSTISCKRMPSRSEKRDSSLTI
mmetsp:Transcript_3378/g.7138  ORF Transcript_3378/g.7138 Transcript_3378/m.7138 type:complete len:302 (-) Transcript_3378:200-1105(-)